MSRIGAVRPLVLCVVVVVATLWVSPATADPGDLTLASTSDAGEKGNGASHWISPSADGSKVAFDSTSTNLDPADTDDSLDVFVKDLVTGDIILASTSDAGVKGNAGSTQPSLSADGTKVAFVSGATNLDPADTDFLPDVYVKDLATGDLTLASTSDSGLKGNSSSFRQAFSANGTMVGFLSFATNLDPVDADLLVDVYLKDLTTGDTTLVSTSDTGVKSNGATGGLSLSSDGTRLAFHSQATNLDPADTDTIDDQYVKDLTTGDVTLASTSDAGVKGNLGSGGGALSSDGMKIAFQSLATNLDPADADGVGDVFVKDLVTGDLSLVSTSDAGLKGNGESDTASISSAGTLVAFESRATNLDPADADTVDDAYVKDLATGDLMLVSTSDTGVKSNGVTLIPDLSGEGNVVGFWTEATNLDAADTDAAFDVYVKELPVPAPPESIADLFVTKSDVRDPVSLGRRIEYSIRIRNFGPDKATGVTLTDGLPDTVVFLTANTRDGTCSLFGTVVTCELGSLRSGGDARVRILVRAAVSGQVTNTASVAGTEADPNTPNNQEAETTWVNA